MNPILVFEQLLNGAGYGLMLFLIAAGLTLVFGIMDVMNLSHGSLFMVGAYVAATVHVQSGSLAGAVLVAIAATMLVAVLLEVTLMRRLYGRDHLAQVLATFGVILVADDAVKMVWGPSPIMAPTPAALAGPVELFAGLPYPSYRLVVLGAGVLVAGLLYLLVNHSRVGMLVRAGASDRWMAELMGVRVKRVFSGIFLLGAALAALAGALMGPIMAVQVGMGESILIPALVVIVIGGIGSVRGAFVAALLVGLVDTIGRAFLPLLLRATLPPAVAADLGPLCAEVAMYALMAAVLSFGPPGLFSARGGDECLSDFFIYRAAARCGAALARCDRASGFAGGAGTVPPGGCGPGSGFLHRFCAPRVGGGPGCRQPELHHGLWWHGGLGSCRVRGRGGLCGGHALGCGRDIGLGCVGCSHGIGSIGGVADWRCIAAHQGRVLHHDHAGFCADAVFRVCVTAQLWRRRRLHPAHAAAAGPGAQWCR